MQKYFLICLAILSFCFNPLFGQDSTAVNSSSLIDPKSSQDSTSVMTISPSEGLNEGHYAFSVGVNFGQFTSKNEDAFIYYILDEENLKYNIKLGFSYAIKDRRNVGVGFRYYHDDTSIEYENAVGDTINTNTLEKRYVASVFYGISKSLFGSKRVFMVSDPSIFFSSGSTDAERTLDGLTELSESTLRSLSIGLHVGLQVFLAPKLSAQVLVGPVGVGYQWEDFNLDGEPNGNADSFFVRMSPNLLSFEFSISRYF